MLDYLRFLKDIPYDFLVSPYGYHFRNMTPTQASGSFSWFMDHIPERVQYLRTRCANDLGIAEALLDCSPESLVLVWRWFLGLARMQKTPKEELAKMEEAAKIFGQSFINKTQFTVATLYMLLDIGMYLGQCFVKNYPVLTWTYYTKPKTDVYVNQPVISGFQVTYQGKQGPISFPPLHMASVQAGKVFTHKQNEQDLFKVFEYWRSYIPPNDESTAGLR